MTLEPLAIVPRVAHPDSAVLVQSRYDVVPDKKGEWVAVGATGGGVIVRW